MRLRLGLSACLLLLLSGCALRKSHVPDGAPVPPDTRAEVIGAAKVRSAELASFKGLARTTVREGEAKSLVRQAIVFELPARLRLETLSPTAAYTLSRLTASPGGVALVDSSEKRVITAKDARILIRRVFGVGLSPEELMYLLTARIPPAWLEGAVKVGRPEDQVYSLIVPGGRRLLFDEGTALLLAAEFSDVFQEKSRAVLLYNRAAAGAPHPPGLGLKLLDQDISFEINFTTAQMNVPVSEKLFSLEAPEGYSRYELER